MQDKCSVAWMRINDEWWMDDGFRGDNNGDMIWFSKWGEKEMRKSNGIKSIKEWPMKTFLKGFYNEYENWGQRWERVEKEVSKVSTTLPQSTLEETISEVATIYNAIGKS